MVNKNPYLRQSLRIAPIQKLTLTPALLQKIELLTLPHLELSEFIKNELLENPFLDETADDAAERPRVDGPPAAAASEAEDTEEPGRDSFDDVEMDSYFQEYLSPGFKTAEYEHYERPEYDTFAVRPVSFYEHLNWQLNLVETRPEVERAAREIIGNVGEDGYLQVGLDEIAVAADVGAADAAEALTLVQGFDPPGVGARDLRECLLIQLRYWEESDTLAYRVLERHAGLVEAGQLDQLDKGERSQHRPDRTHRGVAAIDREQAVNRENPAQVAQAFGDDADCAEQPERRSNRCPQPGKQQRCDQRRTGRSIAGAVALEPGRTQQAGQRPGAPQRRANGRPGAAKPAHLTAHPPATAPPAGFAAGSAGQGTGCNSWRNRDRIPACAGNLPGSRHRGS